MKPLLLLSFAAALVLAGLPALAQDDNLIVLNDATPVIDVVITLPQDTTGTVKLDLVSAAVTLTDDSSTTVFSAADSRLHALELNIAPNTGAHTLTVERLPGVSEAYVKILSVPELTVSGMPELVQSNQLNLNQEVSLSLDVNQPGDHVAVNIPDSTGLLRATFPGANATTQLVDAQGKLLAASYNGHVDGLNMLLDSGQYDFTVLATDFSQPVMAGISDLPAAENGFTLLQAPVSDTTQTVAGGDCTATINVSSVNLRSGPGTGYSVLGYGFRNESFTVGGINPLNNWFVVGTDSGSAWVSNSVAQLDGSCNGLTVFDVPFKEAQPAPVIVVTPQPQIVIQPAPSSASSNRVQHFEDEHEGGHEDD